MDDPFRGLQSIPADALPNLDDVMAELQQPYDDIPDYDLNANPEINTQFRLSKDRAMIRTPTRRLFVDYRANADAYRHITPLPAVGESLHGVISGRYALWDLVPALL